MNQSTANRDGEMVEVTKHESLIIDRVTRLGDFSPLRPPTLHRKFFENFRSTLPKFWDYIFIGKLCTYWFWTKMDLATFWAVFSQNHPVTLLNDDILRIFESSCTNIHMRVFQLRDEQFQVHTTFFVPTCLPSFKSRRSEAHSWLHP
jgi:hypothetical protein